MSTNRQDQGTPLSRDLIQAFQDVSGTHPGFRPAHAKGLLLSGTFIPAAGVAVLTKAPHLTRTNTPVTVRFSNFAGIPNIPDNDPNASPRGLAIRFHLAEHVHTDIVSHSVNGFPTRTAEEFLEFLRSIHASGPDAPKPTPIEAFLATHPAALEFVQAPKPTPTSFATESYFSVSAYKFINEENVSRYGRYQIRPANGKQFLEDSEAASKPANFLFDEIKGRISSGPIWMSIVVQIAGDGDVVDDSTKHWPADRQEIGFGTLELTAIVPDNMAEERHIIFDPIPRVDGIASSGDPLLEPRADIYLMSGRRRRAEGNQVAAAT